MAEKLVRVHLGVRGICPLQNVAVLGQNFPATTGAPGHDQQPGQIVTMTPERLQDLRDAVDAREVRTHRGGAFCCLKTQDTGDPIEPDGERPIISGPAILKRQPLNALVYVDEVPDAVEPADQDEVEEENDADEITIPGAGGTDDAEDDANEDDEPTEQ